jgi:hypothetical protein
MTRFSTFSYGLMAQWAPFAGSSVSWQCLDMATALTSKYEQFRKRLELRNEPSQFHGLIAMRGIIKGHFDPPRPTGGVIR